MKQDKGIQALNTILDFRACNNHIKLYSEIYNTKGKQAEVLK